MTRTALTVLGAATLTLFSAGSALASGLSSDSTSSSLPSLTPDVAIVPFAGDVLTPAQNGSLIPVDPRSTLPSAPLYSFEGNALNLTWGQFSSATALSVALTGTYRGIDYTAVAIEMGGLIPNGVYSLFYRTFNPDSANPICPAVEPTVALTAAFPQFQKPDEDSFVASSSGKAFFLAVVAGHLLDAAQFQIVVIYHFNGQVYGPVANIGESQNCSPTYGIDAMRQFLIIQK
jgi:hypothetical protein